MAAAGTPAGLEEGAFDRPLGELIDRPPVACGPATPLREALETMRREQVGSIVVVDPQQRPLGILTLVDVLRRVTLPQTPLDAPIASVMSASVITAPVHKPAFEAALLMARKSVRHVAVLERERLVGIVSESRLFALWRRSIGSVRAALVEARDIEGVVRVSGGIRTLPARLLASGLRADAVTATLTALNDLIVERLLELTGVAEALRAMNGSWLALGSQGRREQTLATDQDNAILFDDEADPQGRRAALLPLARTVNEALDRCGFALCRGDIMASNPAWCLSLSEWRARFAAWIDLPDLQALLNAAIFFDFRPLSGPHALVDELRAWLAAHARGNDRFLMLMALNAQDNQPPLGVLRDFALLRGGDHPHTIDLKINGAQPFVEAARIYALGSGVAATHTVERLELAAQARGMSAQETAARCDAFRAIQRIRLRLHTEQAARGEPMHNFLDPYRLNAIDRRILKESLIQARSLQSRLARDFSGGGTIVRS
jgi:CBS domain-containing protein